MQKNAHDETWEKNYRLLEEFIAEYQRLPKNSEVYKNTKLGMWCANQKRRAVAPGYSAQRLQRLKEIGLFDSSNHFIDVTWQQHYNLLKTFLSEHNRFPQVQEQYKGYNLGSWYHRQKEMMRRENYPQDRFDKMNALGTDSTTNRKEIWMQYYRLLIKFMKDYHRLPKQMEEYQGVKIGVWCARQKQQVKHLNYPEEYYALLSETGLFDSYKWTLSPSYKYTVDRNEMWDEKYELLLKFIGEYHRFPHAKEVYGNVNIGTWLSNQKKHFKDPDYPVERREKFAAIGII